MIYKLQETVRNEIKQNRLIIKFKTHHFAMSLDVLRCIFCCDYICNISRKWYRNLLSSVHIDYTSLQIIHSRIWNSRNSSFNESNNLIIKKYLLKIKVEFSSSIRVYIYYTLLPALKVFASRNSRLNLRI